MSEKSLTFEPGDCAALLVDEVSRQTGVGKFDLAIVLGSGWHAAVGLAEALGHFGYSDWPCFPAGQVAGHGGKLVAARWASWNILVFCGRFHCYQGLSAFQAAFPVRLAAALGCPRVLLTCATGGINRTYRPGEFMLVDDHVSLLGDNPLRGLPGNTFVDLVGMYRQDIYDKLLEDVPDNMVLHRGILAAMPGPSYETPAEICLLQRLGIDVVSMSTVPEAIMARYLDMQVAAVAFVANYAAGLGPAAISHQDVLDCTTEHASLFPKLIRNFISAWQYVEAADVA